MYLLSSYMAVATSYKLPSLKVLSQININVAIPPFTLMNA